MNDDRRPDAASLRLDWALGETLGGESPPDLTGQVLARHHRGDGAQIEAPPRARPPVYRWLAAAVLLLGTGAVLGALLGRGDAPPREVAPVQDPVDATPPAMVHSLADIERLPTDTHRVLGLGLGDAAVRALLRLPELRELELVYREATVLGLGLKTMPPTDPPCITTASFAVFGGMTKLRSLRLRGAHAVTEGFPADDDDAGAMAAATAATLGQLETLPLLSDLALSHFDVPSPALAALPRLRELRRLDLTANYGVDDASIAAIAGCSGLRSLTLNACMTLPGAAIARLAELPELEQLDLGNLDGVNWRSAPGDFFGPNTVARRAQASAAGKAAGLGVTDAALVALRRAPKLRALTIDQARGLTAGLAALRDYPSLRELHAFGIDIGGPDRLADCLPPLESLEVCGDYTDAFCARLRATQPHLVRLTLPACYAITDRGLADLLQLPALRHLDIRQSRGLTTASLPALQQATRLETLDLRHIDWVTQEHTKALRAALPALRDLQANCDQGWR